MTSIRIAVAASLAALVIAGTALGISIFNLESSNACADLDHLAQSVGQQAFYELMQIDHSKLTSCLTS